MSAVKERPILFSGSMVQAINEGRKTVTRRPVSPQPVTTVTVDPKSESGFELGDVVMNRGWPCRTRQSRGVNLAAAGYVDLIPLNPYGQPGDLLYVRETHAFMGDLPAFEYAHYIPPHEHHETAGRVIVDDVDLEASGPVWYRADRVETIPPEIERGKWRPSIHMPKWAARIWLEVTSVRVERLKAITESDARAEGARLFPDIPVATPTAFSPPPRWSMRDPKSTDECLGTARLAFGNSWNKTYAKRRQGWSDDPWVWVVEFKRAEHKALAA